MPQVAMVCLLIVGPWIMEECICPRKTIWRYENARATQNERMQRKPQWLCLPHAKRSTIRLLSQEDLYVHDIGIRMVIISELH